MSAPAAPRVEQLRDQLGRVLEVAVDHHHRVAAGVVEPRGDRHLVAERAREVEDADPRIAIGQAVEDGGGGVRRPVVDDHELVREVFERGGDAAAELGRQPFLVEHWRHHAEQAQLAGGHGRRESRATATIRCRDARPRKHPPAADRLLPLVPGAVPRQPRAQLGHLDHRADAARARRAAPRHLQVVEVDDPAAAARAADEGDAEEVQGGPAAPAAGDDEVLPRELGQPVRLLPADDRAAAGVPVALLHAARRPPVRHLPGYQRPGHDRPGRHEAVRRGRGGELALHPGPDRQGHGLGARRADRPLRRLAARVDAADVGHRRQEPADDLPGPAVPVRRVHLAVPGRPAPLLDHDEPLDDPAAVDHQEAPRAVARGSRGRGEGGQGADGARRGEGEGQEEGRQVGRRQIRRRRPRARQALADRRDGRRQRQRREGRRQRTAPRPPRRARRRSARGAADERHPPPTASATCSSTSTRRWRSTPRSRSSRRRA